MPNDAIVRGQIAAALICAAVFLLGSWWLTGGGSGRIVLPLSALAIAMVVTVVVPDVIGRRGIMLALTAIATFAGLSFAAATGYAVYHAGRDIPLIDPWLAAADRALGIDWPALLAWFVDHPTLNTALRIAYEGCGIWSCAILLALFTTRRDRRLFILIAANFLALILVHAIAWVVPAVGAFGYYGLDAGAFAPGSLTSTNLTVADVLAQRAAAGFALPDHEPLGLITFPSYHAVIAIHLGWGWAALPRCRVPGAVLTAAILISTIPHGSHHVVDVLAGIAVAVFTLRAAGDLGRLLSRAAYWNARLGIWVIRHARSHSPEATM